MEITINPAPVVLPPAESVTLTLTRIEFEDILHIVNHATVELCGKPLRDVNGSLHSTHARKRLWDDLLRVKTEARW